MPYNFNPNFNKHLNLKKDNYKFKIVKKVKDTEEEVDRKKEKASLKRKFRS